MLIRRILGCTHVLAAPPRMPEGVTCDPLPVRRVGETFASAWEPTPGELAALNAGASVILTVWGLHPPVSLHVENPPYEDVRVKPV